MNFWREFRVSFKEIYEKQNCLFNGCFEKEKRKRKLEKENQTEFGSSDYWLIGTLQYFNDLDVLKSFLRYYPKNWNAFHCWFKRSNEPNTGIIKSIEPPMKYRCIIIFRSASNNDFAKCRSIIALSRVCVCVKIPILSTSHPVFKKISHGIGIRILNLIVVSERKYC